MVVTCFTVHCDSEHATAIAVAADHAERSAATTATTAAAIGVMLIAHSILGYTDTNYDCMKLVIS
jgi:hypothetical protein